MKKLIIALSLTPVVSFGSISLSLDFSYLLNSSGNAIPVGSKGVIVVDSSRDGFSQGAALQTVTLGSATFGASDNFVIGVITGQDAGLGGSGQLTNGYGGAVSGLTVVAGNTAGVINPGDFLAIYWFPNITNTSTQLAGQSYGFYAGEGAGLVPTGSDISWAIPADGFSGNLFAYSPQALTDGASLTPDVGDPTQLEFTAGLTVPPIVPEPSTYAAVFGLLALGYAVRNRKR